MADTSGIAVSVSESGKKLNEDEVPFWSSSRLGLAILGFFGFVNVYALRVNMSVAIVCMVNQTVLDLETATNGSNATNLPSTSQCELIPAKYSNESGTAPKYEDGEFTWNKTVQGLILGSFFWGYILTQIPGGWLATKIGGKRVFGYCMFGATIATFLTPLAAQTSYILLIVLRALVGVTSGVCYPSMHALWGNWAPPMERSKLVAFTYAGAQVGTVITFPLAGFLCKYGFAGGWPSIFYILGMMSAVWFVLWMIFVSDSPVQHKRISAVEREYIMTSLSGTVLSADKSKKKPIVIPWTKIATSVPMYAILVANITTDWGLYTLFMSIPTYMSEVLKLDISTNGLYSALPYIAFWLVMNIAGWLADFVRVKKLMTTSVTRKSFTSFGMIVPGVLLVALGYIDCTRPIIAIVLLVLGVSLTGVQYSGWVVNHMDIAPAFAGILFGISNSIAAVTGFLSPVIVGIVTKDKTREQWQIVFFISAAIYLAGCIFYVIFASGEVQPWALDKTGRTEELERLAADDTELHVLENGKVVEEDDTKKALC